MFSIVCCVLGYGELFFYTVVPLEYAVKLDEVFHTIALLNSFN